MSSITATARTDTLDLEVQTAAHAFAQALAESLEFRAFEQAEGGLSQDNAAQKAILAFQEKQQSLQMMIRLNAVSPEDRAELERLQRAFVSLPSVVAYMEAQEKLTALCQAAANVLSERIGLGFTAACGPGCC